MVFHRCYDPSKLQELLAQRQSVMSHKTPIFSITAETDKDFKSLDAVRSKNNLYYVDNKRIMKLNSSANKEHFYLLDAGIT